MLTINKISIDNALLLAPMEDVTDIAFRRLCKEFGADIVFTEFVNSDGLIRSNKKTKNKLLITNEERPAGIQIYGNFIDSMVEAARISSELKPDIIDINAGCWVKKIAKRGAGAGLLKDPPYMQQMVEAVVKAVEIPVTVKTRIGWDDDNIMILEVARRMEDAGVKALSIHCRTREQGHSGDPDWSWISKIKEVVDIPVILNGGVFTADDVKRAFVETDADGVMIARGAIGNPWIFKQSKELLNNEIQPKEISAEERIKIILRHLRYELEIKDERAAIIPFRKFYSGYLKGFHNVSKVRQKLVRLESYEEIEDTLLSYLRELENYQVADFQKNS